MKRGRGGSKYINFMLEMLMLNYSEGRQATLTFSFFSFTSSKNNCKILLVELFYSLDINNSITVNILVLIVNIILIKT